MPATYDCIANTTLGSTQSSVTFSSISGNYTDLVLVASVKSITPDYLRIRFGNGSIDTGANYSSTHLDGSGGLTNTYRYSNQTWCNMFVASTVPTTRNVSVIVNINNYSNTSTFKSIQCRGNNASTCVETNLGVWRSTSAINTLSVLTNSGSMASGSTFILYGIKAA